MGLSVAVNRLLTDLMTRTEKQRNRLDFLKKELTKPEVLAVVPVAEAYGKEVQTLMDFLSIEANNTGEAIDRLFLTTEDDDACKATFH